MFGIVLALFFIVLYTVLAWCFIVLSMLLARVVMVWAMLAPFSLFCRWFWLLFMILSVMLACFPSPAYDCFLHVSLFCLWFGLRFHCFVYGFDFFPHGFVSGVGLFFFLLSMISS